MSTTRVEHYLRLLEGIDETPRIGRVVRLVGLTIESEGPRSDVGDLVEIRPSKRPPLLAEVVGFRGETILLMPLGETTGVSAGTPVISLGRELQLFVGEELKGRVLDALGRPIDGKPPPNCKEKTAVHRSAPHPLERHPIHAPLGLGVRAIDALITCGRGQRLGIFSGSGVGKSTLLGMMARGSEADVNVIALIGERGREVGEFIQRDLGEEGLARSIVVVATSDQPAMLRVKGAFVATAIAEYFRDQGMDVLLMMDSLTRFALAQREVGLATGEPPATKGYTPSVFALLPRLLERAGNSERGSITSLYTVLVEGDDMNDPVSDAARGILDGHIVLSRRLAERAHFPSIDVLASVSRSMLYIVPKEQMRAAMRMRELLAAYREAEDLINIGAYARGNNPTVDEAIDRIDEINRFLRQEVDDVAPYGETIERLVGVVT